MSTNNPDTRIVANLAPETTGTTDVTLTAELGDGASQVNVLMERGDGATYTLDLEALQLILSAGPGFQDRVARQLDTMRAAHTDQLWEELGLVRSGDTLFAPHGDATTLNDLPEGTPYLRWRQQKEARPLNQSRQWRVDSSRSQKWLAGISEPGWALYLKGAKPRLAFAVWNDLSALRDIAASMGSAPTLLIMGTLGANATEFVALSGRLSVAALRADRNLPAVNLTKARTILGRANVALDGRAWGATLALNVNEKRIPVALILGRGRGGWGLNYSSSSEPEPEDAAWLGQARDAFLAAGWHDGSDLFAGSDDTRRRHAFGNSGRFAILTPTSADTWGLVRPALAASMNVYPRWTSL